jgi:hypothetical protein
VYHYAGNNPIRYTDPDGRILDTPWDVANVVIGFVSIANNIAQGEYGDATIDALGIVLDLVAAGVPGLPGGADTAIKIRRAARTGSLLVTVVQAGQNAYAGIEDLKNGDTNSAVLNFTGAGLQLAGAGLSVRSDYNLSVYRGGDYRINNIARTKIENVWEMAGNVEGALSNVAGAGNVVVDYTQKPWIGSSALPTSDPVNRPRQSGGGGGNHPMKKEFFIMFSSLE